MATKTLSLKAENKQVLSTKKEFLSDGFTDLRCAREYIRECDQAGIDLDERILYLLIDISLKKIEYYEKKCGFEIDDDDIFFVEDTLDFFRKAEEDRISREKQY
jgi:hypothetical protein